MGSMHPGLCAEVDLGGSGDTVTRVQHNLAGVLSMFLEIAVTCETERYRCSELCVNPGGSGFGHTFVRVGRSPVSSPHIVRWKLNNAAGILKWRRPTPWAQLVSSAGLLRSARR